MCSRGQLLSLLPASVATLMFAAMFVCYTLAVTLDHLDPVFPTIRYTYPHVLSKPLKCYYSVYFFLVIVE